MLLIYVAVIRSNLKSSSENNNFSDGDEFGTTVNLKELNLNVTKMINNT